MKHPPYTKRLAAFALFMLVGVIAQCTTDQRQRVASATLAASAAALEAKADGYSTEDAIGAGAEVGLYAYKYPKAKRVTVTAGK